MKGLLCQLYIYLFLNACNFILEVFAVLPN